MAAEDRILKILLQLKADTADASKVTGALKDIETQAEKTAAAAGQVTIGSAGQRITDTTVLAPSSQTEQERAAIAARNAELEKGFAVLQAQSATQVREVALTDEAAAAEARKVLQMERQVIVELQLEAAEARIAGNNALANKLEREAGIRFRALSIQRAMNVSTEEAIVLAERLVLAQEATAGATALAGANLIKAKGEAIVLAREIATGSVNARTMGALLGSLGTTLTVAGIAGFELFQLITSSADETLRMAKESEKLTGELEKQAGKWFELASAASDFKDVVKVGEGVESQLDKIVNKVKELRDEQVGFVHGLWDAIGKIGEIDPNAVGPYQEAINAQIARLRELERQTIVAGNASVDAAQRSADAWEKVKTEPLAQGIAHYAEKLLELDARQAAVNRTTAEGFLEYVKLGREWIDAKEKLDQLLNSQKQLGDQTEKLRDRIKDADLGKLDASEKLPQIQSDIGNIHEELAKLGVDAPTPAAVLDALERIKDLSKEEGGLLKDQVEEVQGRLLPAWLKLLAAREEATKSQSDDARAERQQRINALLREGATLLSDIHHRQQLISQDPFLSTEAKQVQLANSYRDEQQAILKEILRVKTALALVQATGDPKEQAQIQQLIAKLHALGFEYKTLGQNIKALTATGELRADLTAWANSFGSTIHQVAGIITGTLNTAIEQTSQLLTDAIFRTGDWRQALLAVGEAGVKAIIQMALQWVISRTLMAVLNAIFAKSDAKIASSAAQEAAASWSPAAVSASIATYGVASGVGTAAYIAALASGIAAATGVAAAGGAAGGGFKKGGYTGDGDADQVAGPVHKGEFVFDAPATSRHGVEDLEKLRRGAARILPHFADGGEVGPWQEPGALPGTGGNPWADPREGPVHWPFPAVEIPTAVQPYVAQDGRYVFQTPRGPVYIDPQHVALINGRYYFVSGGYGGSVSPSVTISGGDEDSPRNISDVGAGPGRIAGGIVPEAPPPRATGGDPILPGHEPDDTGYIGHDPSYIPRGIRGFYGDPVGSIDEVREYNNWFAAVTSYGPRPGIDPYFQSPAGAGGNPNFDVQVGGSNRTQWNSERQTWERYDPATGFFVPIGVAATSIEINPGENANLVGYTPTGAPVYGDTEGYTYDENGSPVPSSTPVTPTQVAQGGQLIVGHDRLGLPIYNSPGGITRFNAATGDYENAGQNAAYEQSHMANLQLMSWVAMHDPVNNPGQGDERNPRAYGRVQRLNEEGIYEEVGGFRGQYNVPGQGSGAPYLIAGPGGTVDQYNAWVMTHIPHAATGMEFAGGPSRIDSILAMVAPGERVVEAYKNRELNAKYGRNWPELLAKMTFPAMPHFAMGGEVGSPSSSTSSSAAGRSNQPIYIINVLDQKQATLEAMKHPDARNIIVNHVKNSVHEIGIGAVNG